MRLPWLGWWAVEVPVRAGTVFSTGFEAPAVNLGSFGTGNGLEAQIMNWSLFAGSNGSDILNVVRVQSTVVKSGTQAIAVQSASANSVQSGFSTHQENGGAIVTIEADVRLGSATSQTVWQFAAGDDSAAGGFVGGFNIASDDGRFQIITPGFPETGPLVARNTWYHFQLSFDLGKQTYNVLVNGTAIRSQVPFLAHAAKLRIFQFDTFAGGNDSAHFDNFSFTASPPAFLKVLSRTGQQSSLEVNGLPGATYVLENSPDLQTWTNLATVILPASGLVVHTDTGAISSKLFYRAKY